MPLLRVLIVDDDPAVAEATARLLRLNDCEVHTTYSGEQALLVAPAMQPDLIIVDIKMPKRDGYETARLLKAHAWCRQPAFAAYTACDDLVVAQRIRQAGFDFHLRKPAPSSAFLEVLALVRYRQTLNGSN